MTATDTVLRRLHEAERVLIAGDAADLPVIERLLLELPRRVHGQVFIEVFDAGDIRPIAAPPRLTVTWLPRTERGRAGGAEGWPERGRVLVRAVQAWLAEWGLGAELDGDARCAAWLGGRGSESAFRLAEELQLADSGVDWVGVGEFDPGH